MAQVITIAGERLFALKAQNNEQLDVDTFIFANVPGQDPNATIDRNEGLPPVGQIVHQQIVQQVGRVNDNVVIYSTVMDSLTGPFDFNWVGLYSSVNQTLIAVSHIPSVSKTITVPGAAGNTLNRNFGIEYSGIADLTGITVAPETWQLDFTARLSGMDELTRQLAKDMNGKDWFIGDGFKVEPRSTANTFNVTAGAGYVSGLRVELKQDHILTLQSYPQFVYVDAWFDGDASSKWAPKTAFTVTNGEMDDYIDVNGKQHYVFKLARINAADVVVDLRNVSFLKEISEKVETAKQNSPEPSPFQNSAFKPVKWLTTEQIKSLADDFQPVFNCGPSASLQFFEVIFPVTNAQALSIVWDVISSTAPLDGAAVNVSINTGSCSSLSRTDYAVKTAVTAITAGSVITSVDVSQLDKSFYAASIRLNANSNEKMTVKGVKVYQGGKLLAVPNLKLIAPSERWQATYRNVNFVDGFTDHAIRLQLSGVNSTFISPEAIDVSPKGSESFNHPPYSFKFMKTNVYTESLFHPRTIRMMAGEYQLYRDDTALNQASDLNIISVGGKSIIMCGVALPTSLWTLEQTSPRYVYSAPYNWDTNFDDDIRLGTKQPFLTREVPSTKRGSVYKYLMGNVQSAQEVVNADYSYWYDYENKRIHFSFDAGNDNCLLYVAEADRGFNMGLTAYNLNSYNVDIVAAKGDCWRMQPDNYVRRADGGKYVAMSSSGGIASLSENGIRVDNIDHQIIDGQGMSNGNDGFNMHLGGNSWISGEATKSWCNADDGVSHHDQQFGHIEKISLRYNGAGISTPAFGATVYHKDVEGITPEFGLNPSKQYSGRFATISGQGQNTTAWFDGCYKDNYHQDFESYYVNAQQEGTEAKAYVIRARQAGSGPLIVMAGPGTNYNEVT
jgi:hypothetical protein